MLLAYDGVATRVAVRGDEIVVEPESNASVDAVIEATSRDLLAFLLGRPAVEAVLFRGDVEFASRFREVFPGP